LVFQDEKSSISFPILGSVSKTLQAYKEKRSKKDLSVSSDMGDLSISKTGTISKEERSRAAEMKQEPPEERTLAFKTSDNQVAFIRFPSSFLRDEWLACLEKTAARLMRRYVPSENLPDRALKMSILTAEKSANAKIASFLLEGELDDRRWEIWRSYEEIEEMHQQCVTKLVGHLPTTPELPSRKKGQSLGDFKDEMREYISEVASIPIVSESPIFLRFCGA
jgi:hypothetical protein